MSDVVGETLIVIPARGGSKRLPRKNVLLLAGKPLICWTIEAALKTKLNARIMVSSDDTEILGIAKQYERQGLILHKRPAVLATDIVSTVEVMIDALEIEQSVGHNPKTLVLLQPTSPLRNEEDILAALNSFNDSGCDDTVVTVCELDHPIAWVGTIDVKSRLQGIDFSGKRSQEYQKKYRLNGAVYIASVSTVKKKRSLFSDNIKACVMPRERSIDIDELIDLKICESLLSVSC